MVTWTISQYNANTAKVFVTGSSSGAMMTVSDPDYLYVALQP
jgi:poly(3-hydroxybutyrate) depolymerase